MSDKDDADTAGFEVAHQLEELCHLGFVERGCRFVEDEHAALHIHGSCDSYHLLYGYGAACELLSGLYSDAEGIEQLSRLSCSFPSS